jgi:hypothetical protein
MKIEDAGTLNTGQMGMEQIKTKYDGSNVVLYNVTRDEKEHRYSSGEVFFFDEDFYKASKAMKIAEDRGLKDTMIKCLVTKDEFKAAFI